MDKIPAVDNRTEEELLAQLQRRAASYVPEWRFDMREPDAAAAIASAFAGMQHGAIRNFNRLFLKYQTEFFNAVHTSMKPAAPAGGYVVFGTVNDSVEGAELKAGTLLTTSAVQKNGDPVPVETRDDVYVSPVGIQAVYESFDGNDYIGCLYEGDGKREFPLFCFERDNLQRHEFYIGHPSVFHIQSHGCLQLRFFERNEKLAERFFVECLADPSFCTVSYSAEESFVPFRECREENGVLVLEKAAAQEPWQMQEIQGVRMYWMCISVKNGSSLSDWGFRGVKISAQSGALPPDSITANGMDCSLMQYFPFGEQFSVYNEVYFASDEVFDKVGASITLSFWLDFVKIPLSGRDWGYEMDWKLIMPKKSIQVEREYDISIEEVIWEYFNGSGWVRLFPAKEYSDVFGIRKGTYRRRIRVEFKCPRDLSPAIVNGMENRYIRARILKVNNALKTQGNYISPVLTETRLAYDYPDGGVQPAFFVTVNNMEYRLFPSGQCLNNMYPFFPICQTGDKNPTLYIGTEKPWENGPLRLLFLVRESGEDRLPPLQWEYESGGKWRELNPADETEYFSHSGLITFSGPEAQDKRVRFGRELYWIRVRDREGEYVRRHDMLRPFIEGIWENGVKAWTVRSGQEEYLTMERFLPDARLQLMNGSIYSLEMWELQSGTLSRAEYAQLMEENRLWEQKDENGKAREIWVKWEEQENLFDSGPGDRHYLLDANSGILSFGDGIRGRIPAPGLINGIWVRYRIGCGGEGNVPAGAINGLDTAVGFISRVENPRAFFGGSDRETADEAMERTAGEICHRFRAVTISDYERLAREASGTVEKASCFGGRDQNGEIKSGHVTLVLLPANFENSLPFFTELKEQVMGYLRGRLPVGLAESGRFHIEKPVLVEICVSAEIWVSDFNQVFQCRAEILQKLEAFLHPVTGNFNGKGWPIGRLPNRSQIDTILKSVPEVLRQRDLIITGFVCRGGENIEIGLEEAGKFFYALPMSGQHRIKIHVE